MALKLVRFIGSITLGDDNASGIEIGKLGGGSAFRISEFGGQDIFFKITLNSDRTAVTATNGMYLKASTSITVVPEEIIRNEDVLLELVNQSKSVPRLRDVMEGQDDSYLRQTARSVIKAFKGERDDGT